VYVEQLHELFVVAQIHFQAEEFLVLEEQFRSFCTCSWRVRAAVEVQVVEVVVGSLLAVKKHFEFLVAEVKVDFNRVEVVECELADVVAFVFLPNRESTAVETLAQFEEGAYFNELQWIVWLLPQLSEVVAADFDFKLTVQFEFVVLAGLQADLRVGVIVNNEKLIL